MNEIAKHIKAGIIANGIVSILMGALFLASPILAGFSMCYFIGVLFAISGLTQIIFAFAGAEGPAASLIGGIVMFLFGSLCLQRPDFTASLLTIMSGMFIIASGGNFLNQAIFACRNKIGGGVIAVICSIIFILCGFTVMFSSFGFVVVLSGVTMVCEGIFSIIFAAAISDKIAQAKGL